jgi:hypothetical protein
MNNTELKKFLDEKIVQYNTLDFIDSDPYRFHIYILKGRY